MILELVLLSYSEKITLKYRINLGVSLLEPLKPFYGMSTWTLGRELGMAIGRAVQVVWRVTLITNTAFIKTWK